MPFEALVTAAIEDQLFPPGTQAGGWRFSVDGAALPTGLQVVTSSVPSYRFTGLTPGDYVFTGVRLTLDGLAQLGTVRTIQRTIADPSAVPKSIIILGPTRAGNVRYALWVPVPPELQVDYLQPGFTSAWPLATAAENQSIANGEVYERVGVLRGGLTTAEIHTALELRLVQATQALQSLIGFDLENDYWNGTAWVAA